jgi:hypothetical protein
MAERGPKHKFGLRQKTSVEWAPNLFKAIDALRGEESLSVWVEKVLRRDPEIAAQLAAMGDKGFTGPSSRYEQLVGLMIAFYAPSLYSPATERDIKKILGVCQKVVMGAVNESSEEIIERMNAALSEIWSQRKSRDAGFPLALGNRHDALENIPAFSQFFYESIFMGICQGERALLQSRMTSLLNACVVIYQRYRIAQAEEKDTNKMQQIAQEAINLAREEGLDDDDAVWMAAGAVNAEARNQGVIGEELDVAMNAASQAIARQQIEGREV